jgi:cytochrome P450
LTIGSCPVTKTRFIRVPAVKIVYNLLCIFEPGGEGFRRFVVFGLFNNIFDKVQDRQRTNIMFEPAEEHARMRRAAGVGFSDRVLREMEPLIQSSIGLLIRRLRDQCKSPEVYRNIDMSACYNFLTFDLIGNLVMGESYHCLEDADYHPWVRPIFQVTYVSTIMSSLGHYPWFKPTLLRCFDL